ncbi:MAG: amidohydrolase family protein [Proteobacteria bacterium]|nr:amidohydrolase family protein [Pseudomonadota bacterium]
MNRREFMKYSAFLAAAAATSSLISCDDLSEKYVKPEQLVLPGEKLLLSNASVIDVVTGRISTGHILLQNGRILHVFPNDDTPMAYDRALDLCGAYVSPGFINAHCHMSMPCTVSGIGEGLVLAATRQTERNAEECIKHGVTTIRDMASLSCLVHDLKTKINRGNVVGPRMITSFLLDVDAGYLTTMTTMYGLIGDKRYFQATNTPREGRQGVRKAMDQGAGLIKIAHQELPFATILPLPKQMDLKTTRAICNEAARHGINVALHHTDYEGFQKGLDAGVTTFEHIVCDQALTDKDLRRLKDSGAYITPTASVGYAISWETTTDQGWDTGVKKLIADERKRLLVDFAYEYCEEPLAMAIEKEYERYSNPEYFDTFHLMPTINLEATKTILDIGVENLIRCYEAGINMGCGNDGGIPFDFPGAMALEMYILEKTGLKTADILRMATLNNAKLMGMDHDIGTIEAGKIGDLVVFDKNPLETFEHAFKPLMVFQNGELAYKA